jgi:hypothetical protein
MDHPKIIKAGRDARDMWLASITWCAKHLTDGYFPNNLLPSLAVSAGVDVANCQTFAKTLLQVGLWDSSEDGYQVHDYLDYNPTKEQAMATREARKEAGRAGGIAKASKIPSKTLAKTQQNSTPYPYPVKEDIYNSQLSDEFTRVTGILPHNLEDWTKADQELTKAGITVDEIPVVLQVMQSKEYQYSGLPSIVKTARWVHAERAAGRPILQPKTGNGSKPGRKVKTYTNALTGETYQEEIP